MYSLIILQTVSEDTCFKDARLLKYDICLGLSSIHLHPGSGVRCQVYSVSTKCRLQTLADHCFHHGNENKTTIFPLLSNPENNGLQSVCGLHFVLSSLIFNDD